MRTAQDFVEEARRSGLTYYRIAKQMGISPSHLVGIRKGTTPLTEHHAERLAELIGADPGVVYAEAKASRAKRTDVRAFWERVARSLAAGLAACLVTVLLGVSLPAQDAQASVARAIDGARQVIDSTKQRLRAAIARAGAWWRARACIAGSLRFRTA